MFVPCRGTGGKSLFSKINCSATSCACRLICVTKYQLRSKIFFRFVKIKSGVGALNERWALANDKTRQFTLELDLIGGTLCRRRNPLLASKNSARKLTSCRNKKGFENCPIKCLPPAQNQVGVATPRVMGQKHGACLQHLECFRQVSDVPVQNSNLLPSDINKDVWGHLYALSYENCCV